LKRARLSQGSAVVEAEESSSQKLWRSDFSRIFRIYVWRVGKFCPGGGKTGFRGRIKSELQLHLRCFLVPTKATLQVNGKILGITVPARIENWANDKRLAGTWLDWTSRRAQW